MGVASPELMAAAFADRFNANDAVGFAQLYSEDAISMYDGQEKAVGRKQIERALEGVMLAGLKFRGVERDRVCGRRCCVDADAVQLGADGCVWRDGVDGRVG